jgi:hypothetical protein
LLNNKVVNVLLNLPCLMLCTLHIEKIGIYPQTTAQQLNKDISSGISFASG